MLIDTHCHLTDGRLANVGQVLKKAFEAGVERVIIPSTSVEDAKLAVEIAERNNQYCLVGIHPENVEDLYGFRVKPGMTMNETGLPRSARNDDGMDSGSLAGMTDVVIGELEEIIKSSKRVVGVGEIGLDFFYDKERKTKEIQIELFRKQVDLALANNLPVAIHMRGAEEEMKEELENLYRFTHTGILDPLRSGMTGDDGDGFRVKPGMTDAVSGLPRSPRRPRNDGVKRTTLRGQFHCFAGSPEFLETVLAKGFYVSFCGNITYKTAGNLRELLKRVPLDRLLLETDSPYLAPEPLRGTVNTPANVKIIAEFIARELGTTIEKLANSTTENTKCLYSLDI